MAQVIPFRPKPCLKEPSPGVGFEIDLVTAVDVAIRDLQDICAQWDQPDSRLLAQECRDMLEQALSVALRDGFAQ